MDKLENIKIKFLCGIPTNQIDFHNFFENLNWNQQLILIENTILHEKNVKYSVRKEYQIAFLKYILKELESHGSDEIHDKIYECLSACVMKEAHSDFSYKHFKLKDDIFITVKETNSLIRDGTTGLRGWPAAIMLGNYIITNKEYFYGKSIIELGCGCTGLIGLTLLKLCKCREIILSDCHDSVLNSLVENVNLNLLDEEIENYDSSLLIRKRLKIGQTYVGVFNIPWEDIEDVKTELLDVCHPDIILGADLIYDSSIFMHLINCLSVLFELFNMQEFILTQTIRNNETFDEFCKLLELSNFSIEEISLNNVMQKFPLKESVENIKQFRIKKI